MVNIILTSLVLPCLDHRVALKGTNVSITDSGPQFPWRIPERTEMGVDGLRTLKWGRQQARSTLPYSEYNSSFGMTYDQPCMPTTTRDV